MMDIGEPLQIRPLEHNYNINEVLDAIQRVEKPTVHIVEQPASRALRFRYICEGRSAGSIPGASSSPEHRTFPTIEVRGYRGPAQVVVSCVTAEEPYRPHPHKLVGRDDRCAQGVCKVRVDLSHSPRVAFTNLGVQCVKRRDVESALKLRKDLNVDPFNTGFDHMHEPQSIDLNVVRLCFQVILQEENGRKTLLDAVVTDRVYDKKALSELLITRVSRCSASVWGGDEMIILCEKISRDDIEVYFFEPEGASAGGACAGVGGSDGGGRGWQAAADVVLVHKQVAVVLRVPRYGHPHTPQRVQVFVQLRRRSDDEKSNPIPFEYIPQNTVHSYLQDKKKKRLSPFIPGPGLPDPTSINSSKMIKLEPREMMSPTHGVTSPSMLPAPSEPYPPWLAQYDKEIDSILHGNMDATALSSLPGTSAHYTGPSHKMTANPYTSQLYGNMAAASRDMSQMLHTRTPQTVTGVPANMADMSALSPTMPGVSPNMPGMSPNVPTISANVTGTPLNFNSMSDMANYQLSSLVNMTTAQGLHAHNVEYFTAQAQQDQYGNVLPNLEELQATMFEEQCSMSGLLLERADLSSGDLMSLLADRNNDSMKDLKL